MAINRRASWQNPRVLLTLLLVFLVGGLSGALVMRYVVHPTLHTSPTAWTEGGREISLERFRTELDLTDEQSQQMERILDDFMKYYHSLQSQMENVRADGKQQIMQILNADQKLRFEQMLTDVQQDQ